MTHDPLDKLETSTALPARSRIKNAGVALQNKPSRKWIIYLFIFVVVLLAIYLFVQYGK